GERLKKVAAAKDREIQDLKKQLEASRQTGGGAAAMQVDSSGDKPVGSESDKAALERLTAAIAAIGGAPDELPLSHEAAMVAEQERLRAKISADEPIGARPHLLANRCTALEKKKERQLAALDKLHAQIHEIQTSVAEAEKALLETSKELVAAEADRRSAAALAPRPEAGVHSLKATIPALDLSVADVGKMLEAIGADSSLSESIQANFAKLREFDAAAAARSRTQERAASAETPASAAASSAGAEADGDLAELQTFYREVFDAEPPGSEEELRGHIKRFGEQLSRASKRPRTANRRPPPPREKGRSLGQGARPLLPRVLRLRRLQGSAARLWLVRPAVPHSPVTLRAPAAWGASRERAEGSGRRQHIFVLAVEMPVCSSRRLPPPLEMGRTLGQGARPHYAKWQLEMGTRLSDRFAELQPKAAVKGGVVLLSVYLAVGEGLGAQNLEIVQAAIDYASQLPRQGIAWVIGGGWNMEGDLLDDWFHAAGAIRVAPQVPSCAQTLPGTVRDFFFASLSLAPAVAELTVEEGTDLFPRKPVLLRLGVAERSMCRRVPDEPQKFGAEPKVGCARFPPVEEWAQIQSLISDAASEDELASCWDDVLAGIEAELCDRNDIVKASVRRKFCGRAGPPSYSWKPLPEQAPPQPKAGLAWRALGRWLRHLRSVRTKLCQLAVGYAIDPADERLEQISKQFYFLQGFLNRIRKSYWVLEETTETIREFFVDVPSSFSRAESDDVVQGFLDEIDVKLHEFADASRADWKQRVEQAFAKGAGVAHKFSRAREVRELIAQTARPQPFQQADDCPAEWEAI
ncbi:unnamed protein product, partial [Prorocentrum cordatum]